MYHSWNIRRFVRYVIFDTILILAALLLTCAGKLHFAAVGTHDGISLPILMYHSVTDLPERDYCVTPETLENDLIYLKQHGYETVSPEQLIAYTRGIGELPSQPVMITFDDGFYNNYSIALPLLEKYDMCAVISIVGIFTDIYAPDAPHNDLYSYLTWDDLQQALDSGRLSLGSHTYDLHSNGERPGCAKLSYETEEAYQEMLYGDLSLLQSRFWEELQYQPVVFTYPYGFLCDESKPVIRECGFLITMNCLEKSNIITKDPACLYGLNRFNRVGNCDTYTFMHKLTED